MKFKINISGMHCSGCVNLIKMTLEDEGFTNVTVSLDQQIAEFETNKEKDIVESKLSKAFEPFNQYKYSDLQVVE